MAGFLRNKIVASVLTVALTAGIVVSAAPAFAGGGRHYHGGYGGGDLLAAGVVGAFIGAAIARPPAPIYYGGPVYVEPAPVYVYEPPVYSYPYAAPAYNRRSLDTYYRSGYGAVADAEAWTPAWLDYCRRKYRSFDERSGTFMGFDGARHFCVIR